MIEQHYGHLKATMRADVIAGKRHMKVEEKGLAKKTDK
jgi:hypothetical protein